MTKLYDISPPLSPALPVWPDDVPFSREVRSSIEAGERVTTSALRSTAHIGAHADAPAHYGRGGLTIDRCDLATYLGPCRVVHATIGPGAKLGVDDVAVAKGSERALFRTDSYWGRRAASGGFVRDFSAFSVEALRWLAEQGTRLIGIDTPSVDLFVSEDLSAHEECFERDLRILEGVDLREVPAGDYELIALPLRLVGFDGSPVRAVLKVV